MLNKAMRLALYAELIFSAQRGDVEPLIAHLEQGGEISPNLRAFLVAHILGEIRHGPGATEAFTLEAGCEF